MNPLLTLTYVTVQNSTLGFKYTHCSKVQVKDQN